MSNLPVQDNKWLIFLNDSVLLRRGPASTLPDHADHAQLKTHFIREHALGQFNGASVYCAEIKSLDPALTDLYDLIPLRRLLDHLGDDWYSAASKAFSIINWDRNHHYCGRCGHETIQSKIAFERTCPNCKLPFYPRISPSIIVLIQRGDELLMARSPHFHPGVYGLIAGFVEAGESVEAAVHREVYEETRILIKNLRYYGSQPWPFPDSLMIGFFADYHDGDLVIDATEIEDAGWYHYQNLPGRPSTHLSIASKMLEHFILQQKR